MEIDTPSGQQVDNNSDTSSVAIQTTLEEEVRVQSRIEVEAPQITRKKWTKKKSAEEVNKHNKSKLY